MSSPPFGLHHFGGGRSLSAEVAPLVDALSDSSQSVAALMLLA